MLPSTCFQILETKKAKAEETLARENEANDRALQIRLNEVEALEKKIDSIRDPISLQSAISRCQIRSVKLEALHQKEKDEFTTQIEDVEAEIATALHICDEFMNQINIKLKICEENLTVQWVKLETIADTGGD